MNTRWMSIPIAATLLGCASVQPTEARRDVGELVEGRLGLPAAVPEQQDAASRARVRARVGELLAAPLTPDRALQVAMLNNRELRATLEDLGVAQAELVQAGLLQNPVISGDLVVSTRGNGLGGGLALSQSLLGVFLIPAKRRLARARLKHAVVTVGQATLTLARDVRVAFVTAQAAEQAVGLYRSRSQAAEVAHELAERQFDAGNITPLDRQLFAAPGSPRPSRARSSRACSACGARTSRGASPRPSTTRCPRRPTSRASNSRVCATGSICRRRATRRRRSSTR
jgi:cobalt-zinc-cadmium efflux system outer membrane protein